MILAALFSTACRQDKSHDKETFTAITPSYDGAKDYMNGAMVVWNDGDQVRINNGVYTVAVGDDDRHTATINAEGVSAYEGEYYAAYPAQISNVASAGRIVFNLPQEETYTTCSEGQIVHSVMAAKSDANTLRFQNICALLHFQVNASGSGVGAKLRAIEVKTDKPMWGTITTEYSESHWQVTSVTGTDAYTRTLSFPTPLTLSTSAQDIYLVVPPVSNADTFTLRMIVDDGTVKVFEKTRSGATSFTSGTMYHFNDINTYTGSAMKYGDDVVSTITNGSEEHPYIVYSSENWSNLASTMTTANKHITLANDVNVSATLGGEFKAILDGNGHTVTLTTQNISLFSVVNGGTVKNLTIAATNDVTSPNLTVYVEQRFFGSLAGRALENSTFINCNNLINIKTDTTFSALFIGGLLGTANNCYITNCNNYGNIISNSKHVGGIVGQASNIKEITGCNNYGDITISSSSETVNTQYCGGVAGYLSLSNNNNYASNCSNQGNITIIKASVNTLYTGGVFGQIPCCIQKCYNSGTISCNNTINKQKYIGGIIGSYNMVTTLRYMNNCFNEGDIDAVTGVQNMVVGGLIGENPRMSIQNCYSFCNLKGTFVAGICAYGTGINYSNVAISNCYYYGVITCNNNYYGIAGISSDSYKYTIDHCYYPSAYSLCHNTSTGTGNNATLSSATTLTGGGNLYEALNANIGAMPTGSYNWKNSTESPVHVIFDTGSK